MATLKCFTQALKKAKSPHVVPDHWGLGLENAKCKMQRL
jgi:hypothetical protein